MNKGHQSLKVKRKEKTYHILLLGVTFLQASTSISAVFVSNNCVDRGLSTVLPAERVGTLWQVQSFLLDDAERNTSVMGSAELRALHRGVTTVAN